MKRKQVVLAMVVAVAGAAGLAGCKDDSAAIQALQELTTQLSQQVAEQNDALTSMTEKVQGCMKDLATTKGEAVVITSKDASGRCSLPRGRSERCFVRGAQESAQRDGGEAEERSHRARGDEQAVHDGPRGCASRAAGCGESQSEADADAAAKKQAADSKSKAADKKPTAVKKAEEEGTPTKGVRSRY